MEAGKNLICATDGSKSAVNAFKYSCDLFKRSNVFNKIIVISIIDPNKEYLPADLQPEQLEQNIKNSLLCRFAQSKYEVILRRKEVGAKADVLKSVKQNNAGLLVIGFHGRKADSQQKQGIHTLLGSSVEHSMNYSTVPFLVCKTEYQQKDSFTFAVCLDGSSKSLSALKFVLSISNSSDNIVALYAPNLTTDKAICERIKDSVKAFERIKYVEIKASGDPTEALLLYINDDPTYHFDFVLIGSSGQRAELEKKKMIGRTARKVLLEAFANIILFPGGE